MGKLLLGLLKLLLQLAMFALTGHWPRIGEEPAPPARKPRAPRPAGPKTQRKPQRFERVPRAERAPRPEGSPRQMLEPASTWSFEREGSQYVPVPPPLEGVATDAVGRPIFVRRKPVVRTHTIGTSARRSLASAVRDPRTLRDAVVLDALFGARRLPRR